MVPPVEIALEFARARDAGDEFAFRFEEQAYIRREEDGSVEDAIFPWTQVVLDDLAALQRVRPDRAAAQRIGDTLRAFLTRATGKSNEDAIIGALKDKQPVHITFRSSAAELYALPFELFTLRSTGQHLGELPGCLLRYEWPGTHTATPDPSPPPEGGRLLFAWSAAGGAVPASAHLAALQKACHEGQLPFDAARDVLGGVTRDSLRKALDDPNSPVSVLHLLCHGGATDSETPSFGLVWGDAREPGRTDVVDAASLRQLLAPHVGSLRLVVLCACQGGDPGALGNHLGSVAQALHRLGIPAVVASRYPLSVDGSVMVVETLYDRLLVRLSSLEQALLATRDRLGERTDLFDWASLQLYARAEDGPDHRPFIFRPYRGLCAFQPRDRRFYFGREQDVEQLLSLLREGNRMITVVGASGSGKSSLVLAGLVPALQEGALGQGAWRVRMMRPGACPSAGLSAALAPLSAPDSTGAVSMRGAAPTELQQALRRDAEWLAVTVAHLLRDQPPELRLLLVVDQFEETFTQAENAEAAAFIAGLLHATSVAKGRLHVVLTLRADFLGNCLEHRALAERVRSSMDIALPMSVAQLREAIVRPAQLVGIRFENGIVDALIDALREGMLGQTLSGTAAGQLAGANLPLLQFALEELWKRRSGDVIAWGAWKSIGGVRGALAKRADEVLAGFPDEHDQRLIRDFFGRLVQLGDGTADTRRYVARAELEAIRPGEAQRVLERWIHARLLVTDEQEIGVAHEALIREWRTLRNWINKSREALRARQELGQDAERWEEGGRSPDLLWRGGRLGRALELQEAYRLPLSAREAEFLEKATAAKQQEVEAAEAHQRRELAAAHELAEGRQRELTAANQLAESRRRVARGLWISMGLLAAVLLAGGVALVASRQADKARQAASAASADASSQAKKAQEETKRALDADKETRDAQRVRGARDSLDSDPTISLLLLRELEAPLASGDWMETALEALGQPLTQRIFRHEGALVDAALSPDGTHVLTASEDGTVRISSLVDGKPAIVLPFKDADPVVVAWRPRDGARVLVASEDHVVRVWSSGGGDQPLAELKHQAHVTVAAWSPDGTRVLTAARDGVARVWSADGAGDSIALKGHGGSINTAAWSPDGKRVVTASDDRTARVWTVDSGAESEPVVLKGHGGSVNTAAWSPDGKRVVTASDDRTARVWSADGKGEPVVLKGHDDRVRAAAWSPDGARIATVSDDKTARLWSADGKGRPSVLKGHRGKPFLAAWSPDGKHLLTASDGQSPRVWATDDEATPVLVLNGHTGTIVQASWSSDGRHILSASNDGTARVWDTDPSDDVEFESRYGAAVKAASWCPDGQHTLAVLADGTAWIQQAVGAGAAVVLRDKKPILSAAWSPDGARVLTSSDDGTARVWTREGAQVAVFEGHKKAARSAFWRPDGKEIATASADGTVRLWPAEGGGARLVLKHDSAVLSIAWSGDGTRLLTLAADGKARLWETAGGELLIRREHEGPITAAALSRDGKRLFTSSDDEQGVRFWLNGGLGDPVIIRDKERRIRSAVFSADGTRVLTASDENTVRIWAPENSRPVVMVGISASWSPDDQFILTVPRSFPSTVRLWSARGGGDPVVLRGHRGDVTVALWSPNGKRVLTGSEDRTLRIWPIERVLLGEAIQRATFACLHPPARMKLMNESPEQAQATYDKCRSEQVAALTRP